MGTMDAIEFLLSKLKDNKSNADFFDSMNTWRYIRRVFDNRFVKIEFSGFYSQNPPFFRYFREKMGNLSYSIVFYSV